MASVWQLVQPWLMARAMFSGATTSLSVPITVTPSMAIATVWQSVQDATATAAFCGSTVPHWLSTTLSRTA